MQVRRASDGGTRVKGGHENWNAWGPVGENVTCCIICLGRTALILRNWPAPARSLAFMLVVPVSYALSELF